MTVNETAEPRPSLKVRFDDVQRRHPVLGFPWAVQRKYSEDAGGRHAALMTYYGFLSLFPILLLIVAIVSRVLAGNDQLRQEVIAAIVPDQAQATVDAALQSMPSSGLPLLLGVLGVLGSAIGIITTAFDTLNHVAAVPHRLLLRGVRRYLRIFALLALLILAAAAIGGLSVFLGTREPRALTGVANAVAVVGILFLLMWSASALLLPRAPRLREVWLMALLGAVISTAFLAFGAILIPRFVEKSGAVYGAFATIVGLLAFIAIICRVLVYTAEVAVVQAWHLWPRSVDKENPTEADRIALGLLASEQERIDSQRVTSTITN